jgi:molybdopterin-synthase adenylyltransferase
MTSTGSDTHTKPVNGRYSRQILFEPVGIEGQRKISAARVLILGCGGLGASSAEMLARAGAGFLRIADRDIVEPSNLQRQSLFSESDARQLMPKAMAAAQRINEINSDVRVEPVVADVGPRNIEQLLEGITLVVDGMDNFEGRYLLNDACVKHGVPWAYGGAVGGYGLASFIVPGVTPCLRCLFVEPSPIGEAPTCDTAGVISPVLQIISSLQVSAILKWIVLEQLPASRSIVSVDVWDWRFESLAVNSGGPVKSCPCCGERKYDFLNSEGVHLTTFCGRNSVQVCPRPGTDNLNLKDIAGRLNPLGIVELREFVLLFKTADCEILLFEDGRAVVKNTTDQSHARSLISKYIGT